MAPIRRLPVLQNASTTDDDRLAWQWIAIGAVFTLSIWVPLAMVASWGAKWFVRHRFGDLEPVELASRVAAAGAFDRSLLWLVVTGAPMMTYAFACWAAGAMVGRFGAKAG